MRSAATAMVAVRIPPAMPPPIDTTRYAIAVVRRAALSPASMPLSIAARTSNGPATVAAPARTTKTSTNATRLRSRRSSSAMIARVALTV